MNKDVIYIDVDDDVTAIIGKIKNSKEKIVAIVPPKRAGALQSAVNLRLLDRMAKNDKKQLVLITNNHALAGLAANAKIPIAKNLQSKPELAEIPALAVDDGDDIIDGAELPVGDLAKTVKAGGATAPKNLRSEAIDDIDTEGLSIDGSAVSSTAASAVAATKRGAQPAKKSKKIPDFDVFRKKLIFIILGGAGLVALLVWMFVFAPAARVIITASTTPVPVSASVKLGGPAASDIKTGVISSVSQAEKKDVSVEFTATGQKDVGEKATGTVRFTSDSFSALMAGISIPAGTRLNAGGGRTFTTDAAVTLSVSAGNTKTVNITATDSGEKFNGANGSVSGAPSSVSASITGGATSGGTSKVVKVVSADDIERAKGDLLGKSSDEEKKALIKKFTNGEVVIDSSFTAETADPVATPAVDQESPDGKASLTVSTTYTIQAVSKSVLESYLKSYLESKLDKDSQQKVYSAGVDKATLTSYQKEGDVMTATIIATGSVGPEIDEAAIKDQVKGKIYGEVQQSLQSVSGIKEVDVKFSYFWVRKVPNDPNKITIEFKVDSANGK